MSNKENGDIFLLGIVKGLVSTAEKLEGKISNHDFKLGALPISKEELDGLKEFLEEEKEDIDIQPSTPEKIYAENLSEFGEVSLPPPSYIEFLKYCERENIEVKAIDMDDEHYTMAYCDYVSGSQWLWQSFREKRLPKKKFDCNNAEDFAIEWDKEINKLSGYKDLEKHREEIISKNLHRLSKRGDTLSLIEIERLDGIINILKEKGWDEYHNL